MNKKIVSIFLLTLLMVSFVVPAYADSEELNTVEVPKTDPQVQAVNEAIERLDLPVSDLSEEIVMEALEAEGINATADKFAYVFDFAGLEAAFADEDVNIILLLADIQMEYELTIDRDISMSGVMGATITSADTPSPFPNESNPFHFVVSAPSGSISLIFSNVILDGGNVSGGIFIKNSVYISGAVVQNCSNLYAAITTHDRIMEDRLAPYNTSPAFNIILEGCTIADNTASRTEGGGVRADSDTLVITGSDISRNSSTNGGGISTSAALSISDSKIESNTADGNGGGIKAVRNISIENSSIKYNQARNGGGIYIEYAHRPQTNLAGTDISYNTASNAGGGMFVIGSNTPEAITGGTFEGNAASTGGALYISPDRSFSTTLSDMRIRDNSAENGGGIFIAGDLYSQVIIEEDVTFSANTADKGYYMTDEDDIAIHDTHVFTTHFSEPFTQYAYNNFDISYTRGEELTAVTASFYLRYSDAEPYETAIVYAGQALGNKLPEGPEQTGLKFIGWTDINGVIYNNDTVITENVSLYPAYILD